MRRRTRHWQLYVEEPPHLLHFTAADWLDPSDPPEHAQQAAVDRWRHALTAWCDEHDTDPLEQIRERRRRARLETGLPALATRFGAGRVG